MTTRGGTALRRCATLLLVAWLVAGCAAAPSRSTARPSPAADQSTTATTAVAAVTTYKSPTCTCCVGWETYMRAAGWSVDARPTEDMAAMKDRLGVPAEARSCHTSTVAGYVVEGHVPLAAIERLLAERPAIRGIALPGMEPGSPGMDGAGDAFEVVSIGADGSVGAFGTFPA